jgi:hypothetical protein
VTSMFVIVIDFNGKFASLNLGRSFCASCRVSLNLSFSSLVCSADSVFLPWALDLGFPRVFVAWNTALLQDSFGLSVLWSPFPEVSRFEVFGHQLDLSQWLISRLALCSAFHSTQEQQPHCSESVLPPTAASAPS